MYLQRDSSCAGDGICSVLQQILYHPLHQRSIQHYNALHALQAFCIDTHLVTYSRTDIRHGIQHHAAPITLLQFRLASYLLESVGYHLQTVNILAYLRHILIFRVFL